MRIKRKLQMKTLIFLISLAMTLSLMVGVLAFSAEIDIMKAQMKKLLPQEMLGYKADVEDEFYDRQTSFRYMDGAAELYRSFGF
jgi:hypothetical protein